MVAEHTLWPDFNGTPAVSFPRGNGTEYILFGDDASRATPEAIANNQCNDMTRIIHQKIGWKALLCGTYVHPHDRGAGIGEKLIDYFMENAPKASGEFGGTTIIHKPIIAAQLARLCLYPVDTDFLVAIPRREKERTLSDVPDIIIVRDNIADENRWRIKSQAGRRHKFYNVVGEPGWGEQPKGSMPQTYLHTRFTQL